MKIGCFSVLILWVALGIFNFGAMNAQEKWEDQHEFADLHRSQRDDLGFIVGESCLIPPVELISTLVITNFLQHGWTLQGWEAK